MAVLSQLGRTTFNNRGSMTVQLGIVANDPGTTAYNNRGSMTVFAQTAVTLTFTTASPLPDGTNGIAYSQSVVATGGIAPYTYAVTAGTLPTSLTMDTAGSITGTPSANGLFSFTVTATDSQGNVGSKVYTITINAGGGGGTFPGDPGAGGGQYRFWIGMGF